MQQRRGDAASQSQLVSNGLHQTAACTSQPAISADREVKSTQGQQPDDEMQGNAEALPTMVAARGRPDQFGEAVSEVGGGAADASVPECLRRMAKAGDDSEVVFLGTGCAEPSKYRGASGILLRCG